MKKAIIYIFVASLVGCGQMGPLYLPNQKPPIYVPKPKKETHSDTISSDKKS